MQHWGNNGIRRGALPRNASAYGRSGRARGGGGDHPRLLTRSASPASSMNNNTAPARAESFISLKCQELCSGSQVGVWSWCPECSAPPGFDCGGAVRRDGLGSQTDLSARPASLASNSWCRGPPVSIRFRRESISFLSAAPSPVTQRQNRGRRKASECSRKHAAATVNRQCRLGRRSSTCAERRREADSETVSTRGFVCCGTSRVGEAAVELPRGEPSA